MEISLLLQTMKLKLGSCPHIAILMTHWHLNPPPICKGNHPVRLAYQPPANSTFLSQQISHQQPANSTLLSEQTSTSHQPPANRTGWITFSPYFSSVMPPPAGRVWHPSDAPAPGAPSAARPPSQSVAAGGEQDGRHQQESNAPGIWKQYLTKIWKHRIQIN
jgi:hypothetical protein